MKPKVPAKKLVKGQAKKPAKSSMMQMKLNNLLKKHVRMSQQSSGNKSGQQGRSVIRSTGVLKKNPTIKEAQIDFMNRRSSEVTATILYINWDSNNPQLIATQSDIVPSNTLAQFSNPILDVEFHYEIVVIQSHTANVIVNYFGSDIVSAPQTGNVVLDRDLIPIKLL
ncbi:hypothetical protein [Paenibacillus herberti]|uniref:Uncharacterized protein n=1 Tax=Paenibacillus herberti TaxID=1619309 RepID=A0A229P4U6_9BACL|nr:hypothetical protein [Paenibacillus herberti]OXM17138.1 hypothetical protein CGZ75_11100 [Paenibacillus herberti]